jgi:hypothetical protein
LEATQESVANKEARRQRARDGPFADPAWQARSARAFAAAGWPFLWILSFGHAKESISPSGATNRQESRFARLCRPQGEAQDVLSETGFKGPSRSETDSGNLFSTMSLASPTGNKPLLA